MKRTVALVAKDFAELRHSPGIFIPALLTGCAAIFYPFVIAIIIPAQTKQGMRIQLFPVQNARIASR